MEPPSEPRSQAARSAATQRLLLDTARRVFTQMGYSGASTEEIVRRAGLTRGALYHHFHDKRTLFQAVFIEVAEEFDNAVRDVARGHSDPWEAFVAGCRAGFGLALRPDVRRILLTEAPAVLGWDTWRQIDSRYALRSVSGGLRALAAAGYIEEQPFEPLANVIVGALNYGMMAVAASRDPAAARPAAEAAIERLLRGLRID